MLHARKVYAARLIALLTLARRPMWQWSMITESST